MPRSKSIDDRILPLIQYDFPGNRHALAHGVYRVAAFIGELRDFRDRRHRRFRQRHEAWSAALLLMEPTSLIGRINSVRGSARPIPVSTSIWLGLRPLRILFMEPVRQDL